MNTALQRFWRPGVLALLIAGMLFLGFGGYLAPVLRLASSPVIAIQGWIATRYLAIYQALNSPQDMAELRQQSATLLDENARLQSQVIELQQQLKDSQFKDELLGFARSRPEDTYVGASVIGRDPSPFLHYVIIDRGSDDGLRHGMPVVTAKGLVGRIDAVIANAARVQLVNDPGSSVNVQLATNRTESVLVGSITGDVTMEMVPQDAQLKPGDVILTSGLGGSYPPNILIGQVVSVRKLETELFQSASVQPSVNFSDLRVVLVVVDFSPIDTGPLIPSSPIHNLFMAILVGIPIILLVVMLQTVVISTLPLLHGTADLVLLVVAAWSLQNRLDTDYSWALMAGLLLGLVSRVPWFVPVFGLLAVTFVANFLRRQVWQTPVLAMMITVLIGSLLLYALQWGTLLFEGVPLPLGDSINLVVLPATFLNLLFALPVYALVTELYQSVFPEEVVG